MYPSCLMASLIADAARMRGEPDRRHHGQYHSCVPASHGSEPDVTYQPDNVRMLVRMAETGSLSCEWLDIVAKFPLENWEKVWSTAAEKAGPRAFTVIEPQE